MTDALLERLLFRPEAIIAVKDDLETDGIDSVMIDAGDGQAFIATPDRIHDLMVPQTLMTLEQGWRRPQRQDLICISASFPCLVHERHRRNLRIHQTGGGMAP